MTALNRLINYKVTAVAANAVSLLEEDTV